MRTKTSFLGLFKKLFLYKEVQNCFDDLIYITTHDQCERYSGTFIYALLALTKP